MSPVRLSRLALSAMVGLALLTAPAPAAAQAPSPNATYSDGFWQIPVEGGEPLTTHGLDAPITAATDDAYGYRKGDLGSVVCAPNGENRYRAVYAHPFDIEGDLARRAPQLRQVLMDASTIIDANAQRFGVHAKLPVLCAGGHVAVSEAVLGTPDARMNLETVFRDLHRLGFAKPHERYVVFIDGCFRAPQFGDGCANGGLGTIARDDRATPRNYNNNGRRYALEFGPPEKDAGGHPRDNPTWYGLLHEIGHTMGAVQASAPHAHSTSRGHCDQGRDFMCYDLPEVILDPAPGTPCPTSRFFDCNNDDYFHPSPPAGSYLAGHWNLGSTNNHWLRFAPVGTAMR